MIDPSQIIPLYDRVLVEVLSEKPRLDGLILVKNDSTVSDAVNDGTVDHADYRRVPLLGRIVAVGPGKHDIKWHFHPTTVKPGEVVIFTSWDDADGLLPGHHMIREGDIWGYPAEN